MKNNLDFEGRYIAVVRKAENPLDLPTDIEDLKELETDGLFTLYGPEGADYKKDLGEALLSKIKNLRCDSSLVNYNILFWAGRTSAYISYDDAIVAIPYDKPINKEAYFKLKENVKEIIEVLK